MVATTGSQLLPVDAVKTLLENLLPVTFLLTPNIAEALLLLRTAGREVSEPQALEDLVNITKSVLSLGPKYVLLKGGHLPLTRSMRKAKNEKESTFVVNILQGHNETIILQSGFLASKNTHGTGCSLACKFSRIYLRPANLRAS